VRRYDVAEPEGRAAEAERRRQVSGFHRHRPRGLPGRLSAYAAAADELAA
jgi:hypothetical protein